MSETIKFTKEELDSITALQQEYQTKALQLGQLEIEKLMINKRIEDLNKMSQKLVNEFTQIQEKEAELSKKLNEKYGNGTLNPQTGEFIPTTSNVPLQS